MDKHTVSLKIEIAGDFKYFFHLDIDMTVDVMAPTTSEETPLMVSCGWNVNRFPPGEYHFNGLSVYQTRLGNVFAARLFKSSIEDLRDLGRVDELPGTVGRIEVLGIYEGNPRHDRTYPNLVGRGDGWYLTGSEETLTLTARIKPVLDAEKKAIIEEDLRKPENQPILFRGYTLYSRRVDEVVFFDPFQYEYQPSFPWTTPKKEPSCVSVWGYRHVA